MAAVYETSLLGLGEIALGENERKTFALSEALNKRLSPYLLENDWADIEQWFKKKRLSREDCACRWDNLSIGRTVAGSTRWFPSALSLGKEEQGRNNDNRNRMDRVVSPFPFFSFLLFPFRSSFLLFVPAVHPANQQTGKRWYNVNTYVLSFQLASTHTYTPTWIIHKDGLHERERERADRSCIIL